MTAIAPDGEFSLIQLTQDVLATTDATEMREIAQEIADLVPVQHLRWALSEALVSDALRITAKEILKDLWREAKRLHEEDQ